MAWAVLCGTVGVVATWDDVRREALALPHTREGTSHGTTAWFVKDKLFAWERPLRAADLEWLGAAAPAGPILGLRVEHLGAKEAVLSENPRVYFTTPHFDGYPAVLARLDDVGKEELHAAVVEAWLARAPKRAVEAYLAEHGTR